MIPDTEQSEVSAAVFTDIEGCTVRSYQINRKLVNYPFPSQVDPFLANIRGEPRFKKLMERVKYEWEHFEV